MLYALYLTGAGSVVAGAGRAIVVGIAAAAVATSHAV